VGCGTGNYTIKFIEQGYTFTGLDPSESMLEIAKTRQPDSDWRIGSAEKLPIDDQLFDGALITLSMHHWSDLEKGCFEIARVLKSGGRIVLFTPTPFQIEKLWLREYFPIMLDRLAAKTPAFDAIEAAMKKAGITITKTEKYEVHDGLQDLFLSSGTFNPKLYLDPNFRKGISSFSAVADPEEVDKGLIQLETDINSGRIDEVIDAWKNDLGDYLFIQAKKS
jgi:SAM-dependent methyltransferase